MQEHLDLMPSIADARIAPFVAVAGEYRYRGCEHHQGQSHREGAGGVEAQAPVDAKGLDEYSDAQQQ
ncbi:hypothetical protein [Halomonas sp. H5]|uniref:hypothetical protein n=1 Tax=Halomonas sp. H5 TaxID=3423910 RepID=UPI003D367659